MREFKVGDWVEYRYAGAYDWSDVIGSGRLERLDTTTMNPGGQWRVRRADGSYVGKFPKNIRHAVQAPAVTDFGVIVDSHLEEIQEMMVDRHKKYGPGNISEFGELGLLVRLGDKIARLKNNQDDFSDESVDDTISDIIGYSLIWKMVRAGDWPS